MPNRHEAEGFGGDISKVDLTGILAHLSTTAVEWDALNLGRGGMHLKDIYRHLDAHLYVHAAETLADVIVAIFQRCSAIAQSYIAEDKIQRVMRLHRSAFLNIPPAFTALKRMQVLEHPAASHGRQQQVIRALIEYAAIVHVPQKVNLANLLEPEPTTFRTCAYSACLCAGKLPGHRLRVCSGCYMVYYCNSECQAK